MKKKEILNAIKMLAKSQGFYGRLLADIEESGNKDEILLELERKNFKDVLDMVYFFEV